MTPAKTPFTKAVTALKKKAQETNIPTKGPDDSLADDEVKLEISENALKVLKKRVLKRDQDGNPIEEPMELFNRVANNIAQADKNFGASDKEVAKLEKDFLTMLTRAEFMPNSPTLVNAGRDLQQLSACFVLPVEDSVGQIFDSIKHTALIHKSGGGTGFSFSRLRPKGARVKSTHGVASGPVSFMRIFNAATEEIKQGGTRRGANMGILRVDHPDVEEFVKLKEDLSEMNNFNISVAITNKFMDALEQGEKYDLVDPSTKEVVAQRDAQEIFDLIVHHAWLTGDPGVVFIDRINEKNPTRHIAEMEATNPCGEQPLSPYDSCNLGSINLAKFVKDKEIDYDHLGEVIHNCVHFLDNVIEMNKYPIPEIKETTRANRRIGLGPMGFADLLIKLGIPYNSQDALELGRQVMGFIQEEGHKASQELADKRGNFPNHPGSPFEEKNTPMRNATVTTIAPTGTISMIADASSGIEPLFAVVFTKTVMDGTSLLYVHPGFERIAKEEGWYSEELMKKVAEKGGIQDFEEIPDYVKKVFVTAQDLKPEDQIRMQAAFQEFTDNAVSKTVNFPNEATEQEVANVYKIAWETSCKGVTVFRDGCRDAQVLTTGQSKKKRKRHDAMVLNDEEEAPRHLTPRQRPEIMQGMTYKVTTGYGNLYVTINEDEGSDPFEVFATIGKTGGFFAAKTEAVCRLVSLALRSGIKPEDIVDQIKGIRGPSPVWYNGGQILSLPDAIGQVLERHLKKEQPKLKLQFPQGQSQENPVQNTAQDNPGNEDNSNHQSMADSGFAPVCPDCGGTLEVAEGCMKCHSCGYTKCG